jgi:hypothetical protein
MNFSTVPPSASISARIAAKNASITSRIRSGSSRSPSVVEPVTSANRTVTSLRSRPPRGVSATADPQFGQKRAPRGRSVPQIAQTATAESVLPVRRASVS